MTDVTVVLNRDAGRYEAQIDGAVAGFIVFRTHGTAVDLRHTEVDDAYEGQGVGSALVAGTLQQIRDEGLQLIPTCPFVAAYLRRHPEDTDLLAES